MNYEEIKAQALKHKGLKFVMEEFRRAFNIKPAGTADNIWTKLIDDGVVSVCGHVSRAGKKLTQYEIQSK